MAQRNRVMLAVDLGASSGRLVAGLLDGERLRLEDVHRFENGGVLLNDSLYWNLLSLWSEIRTGLRRGWASYGADIVSVGVDTWGVDFALLGRGDELLGNPHHYRDRRTAMIFEQAFGTVSRDEIFAETGLQFMEFNTLFQLLAMKLGHSSLLEQAESLLMVPDLFHWLLTGQKANEYTEASTTQFLNPQRRDWSRALLERFGLPTHILGRLAEPGTRLGKLRRSLAETLGGLSNVDVVLPGSHDTASAVMAVPAKASQRCDWCYISSGTWSLMGVEVPQPVVTPRCGQLNFTNEGGVGRTVRLLKNIAGLWLVQECRRTWQLQGRDYPWSRLVELAQASRPFANLVNPDAACFVAPSDMPQAIAQFCQRTGQPVPASDGAVIRGVLESLAFRYRTVLQSLEELAGAQIETIHIVGGGTQNQLLCQMAADACRRRVVAGPVEATAIGNLMMQAVSNGDLGSIADAREVIRRSFDAVEYLPSDPAAWDDAYPRFLALSSRE